MKGVSLYIFDDQIKDYNFLYEEYLDIISSKQLGDLSTARNIFTFPITFDPLLIQNVN